MTALASQSLLVAVTDSSSVATPPPQHRFVDVRDYIPASGATGQRFSEAHAHTVTSADSPSSAAARAPRSVPQAPLGVFALAAAPLSALTPAQRLQREARVRLEALRVEKWRAMLASWDAAGGSAGGLSAAPPALAAQLKRRCRKGIPEAARGAAWQRLLGADAALRADPTLYEDLLSLPVRGEGETASVLPAPSAGASASTLATLAALAGGAATVRTVDTIERDINRTFPGQPLFAEIGGPGQTALFRVLVAYAQLDGTVGYCQGMGFVAALLLSFAPEATAFHMLRAAMQLPPLRLADIYAPGLPRVAALQHALQGLINVRLPAAAAALHRLGLHPTMWASQWLLTVFTSSFPLPIAVRVWDAFLAEGWKVVFRVALAALKVAEPDLARATGLEEAMAAFKALPSRLDADRLLSDAFALRLASADIARLEDEARALLDAGYELAGPLAGKGLAAHAAAAAAANAKSSSPV